MDYFDVVKKAWEGLHRAGLLEAPGAKWPDDHPILYQLEPCLTRRLMMPGIADEGAGSFFCGHRNGRDGALARVLVEANPLLPQTPETVERVSASLDATVEEIKRSLTAAPTTKTAFGAKAKPGL